MGFSLFQQVVTSIHDLPAATDQMQWPGQKAVQIDPGNLATECTFVENFRYGMLGFKTNRRVFMTGPRNTAFHTFCVIDHGTSPAPAQLEHNDYGDQIDRMAMCGMIAGKDHESFTIGRSGTLLIAAVPWDFIDHYLNQTESLNLGAQERMRDAMSKFNQRVLDPEWYQRLTVALRRRTFMPKPDIDGVDFDQLMALIIQCMVEGTQKTGVSSFPESAAITRALVEIAYSEDGSTVVTLEKLCEKLRSSERTIQHDSNRQVGIGPMDFLRRCRFQQVNRALIDRPTAQLIDDRYGRTLKINEVFDHFGLTYNSRSRGLYKEWYGRTPKQDQMDSRKKVVVT